MQPTYKVDRIRAGQIDAAFLLVQPVAPAFDLDEWRSFCRESLAHGFHPAGKDDIVVATNRPGYVQGVSVGAVRRHPVHGRILDVSLFVVMSAADEAGVAGELGRYLKALARSEACGAIRIGAAGSDNWIRHLGEDERLQADPGLLVPLGSGRPAEA